MNQGYILRRAAEIVRAGHCKFTSNDDEGRHCALGAVGRATIEAGPLSHSVPASLADLVGEVVKEQYPDRLPHMQEYRGSSFHCVVRFNDHPDTTAEEVALVLEKAAVRADER